MERMDRSSCVKKYKHLEVPVLQITSWKAGKRNKQRKLVVIKAILGSARNLNFMKYLPPLEYKRFNSLDIGNSFKRQKRLAQNKIINIPIIHIQYL